MRSLKPLFGVLMFIFLASCGFKDLRVREHQVSINTPNPAKPPDEFYVIGFGDVIGIHMWKEDALSGSAQVRPDGFITLPLVNEIQVVGLTTGQLREVLQQKYSEFVSNPFVTIRIQGISSSEVFLIGQVNKPGAYPLTGNDSLLQLLTRAGGLSMFADTDDIRVVRRNGDKITEYLVDYDAIIKGDLKQDILLRPGDRIIVP
jgi:polysaccharide export outer membrane protein